MMQQSEQLLLLRNISVQIHNALCKKGQAIKDPKEYFPLWIDEKFKKGKVVKVRSEQDFKKESQKITKIINGNR